MRIDAASASDLGNVRSNNQDRALVAGNLVAVADGMGGHAGGEVAAEMAVDVLGRFSSTSELTAEGLVRACGDANAGILEKAEGDPALRGMGTTLVAAALVVDDNGEKVVVVNVGDSRAYLLPGNGRLARLTEDHSLVEEMVRRGELSLAQAAVHPHRHILTRALGIDPSLDIDAWELDLDSNIRLLLCSDGLTNECTDAEIEAVLSEETSPDAAARALIKMALAHGGSDNVTVVVADLAPGQGLLQTDSSSEAQSADANADEDRPLDSPVTPAGANSSLTSQRGSKALAEAESGSGRGPTGTPKTRAEQQGSQRRSDQATKSRVGQAGVKSTTVPMLGRSSKAQVVGLRAGASGYESKHIGRDGSVVGSPVNNSGRYHSDRVLTVRVAVFFVALVAILGGTSAAVIWYVRTSWFVGVDSGYVAIYQGRPGGFLWFKPYVYERTDLAVSQVFPPELPYLRSGMLQQSLGSALKIVADLSNTKAYLEFPTGNTGPAAEVLPVGVGTPAAGYITTTTSNTPTTMTTSTTSPPANNSGGTASNSTLPGRTNKPVGKG